MLPTSYGPRAWRNATNNGRGKSSLDSSFANGFKWTHLTFVRGWLRCAPALLAMRCAACYAEFNTASAPMARATIAFPWATSGEARRDVVSGAPTGNLEIVAAQSRQKVLRTATQRSSHGLPVHLFPRKPIAIAGSQAAHKCRTKQSRGNSSALWYQAGAQFSPAGAPFEAGRT